MQGDAISSIDNINIAHHKIFDRDVVFLRNRKQQLLDERKFGPGGAHREDGWSRTAGSDTACL